VWLPAEYVTVRFRASMVCVAWVYLALEDWIVCNRLIRAADMGESGGGFLSNMCSRRRSTATS